LPEVSDAGSDARLELRPELFLLLNRVRTKAWFLRDPTFTTPKAFLYLKFTSGCASDSPRNAALTHLFVLLVQVRVWQRV
jgi:secreted Zn-dependent insulinase-like peptidase